MSDRRHSVFIGWWVLTCRAIRSLTAPPSAVAACDREAERLARESWLGSTASRAAASIAREWRESRVRAASAALKKMTPASGVAAVRTAGWTALVAGMTTVTLNALKPVSAGPLIWVLPAVAAAIGVLMMVAPAVIERFRAS